MPSIEPMQVFRLTVPPDDQLWADYLAALQRTATLQRDAARSRAELMELAHAVDRRNAEGGAHG